MQTLRSAAWREKLSESCFRLERMSEELLSRERGPTVSELESWMVRLGAEWPAADARTLIDQIALLERIKAAASAAQARLTVALKESRIAERKAAGEPTRDLDRGIGAEVALARRQSPYWGSRFVGVSDALVHEMPHTLAALTRGDVSEWRATLVVQETACLSRADRTEVDERLRDRLGSLSDRAVRAAAKKIGYQLDPASVVDRSRRAEGDRRVTSWPAPDTMMNVCALLPMVQGAAVMAALTRAADAKRAEGDLRSRGQLMTDIFVEQLTGQARADQTPVEVQLLMSARTLLDADQTPAWLVGHGPVAAPFVRGWLRSLDDETRVWVRRLLTDPVSCRLTAVDKRRRLFKGAVRRAIIVRDQFCRTPWCGAPIRHLDHVIAVEDGGESSEANGQGLCEACNYGKEAPGWRSSPSSDGAGDSTEITTPTGHTYRSRPPPLPGVEPPRRRQPRAPTIEIYLRAPDYLEYVA